MLHTTIKKWIGLPISCENPKSIFVGLIGGVGDLIAAAPPVAALKKKYPEAKLYFGVGGSGYGLISFDSICMCVINSNVVLNQI